MGQSPLKCQRIANQVLRFAPHHISVTDASSNQITLVEDLNSTIEIPSDGVKLFCDALQGDAEHALGWALAGVEDGHLLLHLQKGWKPPSGPSRDLKVFLELSKKQL